MNDPLVDADGYPRNDIDVHQVRNARHQIICLQNDVKSLLKQIEVGIHAVHADAKQAGDSSAKMRNLVIDDAASSSASNADDEPMLVEERQLQLLTPIVHVNLVSSSSPAELAVSVCWCASFTALNFMFFYCAQGLELNDKIVEFGSLNSTNFTGLNQIADIVRHRQNQTIVLKVKRDAGDRVLSLRLVPKTWSGRGLLGCNIILCNNNL